MHACSISSSRVIMVVSKLACAYVHVHASARACSHYCARVGGATYSNDVNRLRSSARARDSSGQGVNSVESE